MKILALVVGSIAMLPSVCLADNISGNNQGANLNSNIVGNGNVVVIQNIQSITNSQNPGSYGISGGNSQRIDNRIKIGGHDSFGSGREHERRGHHRREHERRDADCQRKGMN
jgi:hypothetical protein